MNETVLDNNAVAGVTRRTVLAGAALTAAATVATTAPAAAQSANPREDMDLFMRLSAALTGIAETKLGPAVDPVNVKGEYFIWINERYPSAFENLLRLAKESSSAADPAETIVTRLQFADTNTKPRSEIEAKYLARSIVLMWYLGAWYDPRDLEAAGKDLNPERTVQFTVISPKAYTQAWALRVAQAHPMGFSEMQFGYWHRPPNDRIDFVGGKI
jgi:hypothetical protein